MSGKVIPPFEIFKDVDGEPLEAGYIYIGQENLDPETNLVSVYYDADLTIPASQPLRTVAGAIQQNGAPSNIFVSGNAYSITVRNKNGSLVYTSLSVGSDLRTLFVADYTELRNSNTAVLVDGTPVEVTDLGIAGSFIYRNVPGHGLSDNAMTIIVINPNWYAQRVFSGLPKIEWVAPPTGTTDTATFNTAFAAFDVVEVPEDGIYGVSYYLDSELRISGADKMLVGAGKRKTTILAADGITAIRMTSRGTLKGFTLRCDRPASGTWSSTAAKGIYWKNGADAVASAPSAYIEGMELDDILVERFYENVELRGGYWTRLNSVECLHGFQDFILNRSVDTSFTGTTLSIRDCWARGNGGTYSTPAGSRGWEVWHWTNIVTTKLASERHEDAAWWRTIQGGQLIDHYYENCTNGPKFHTLTGNVDLKGVYYNNIGDQFVSGGYTIEVSFGKLFYEPSRFVNTDDSAKIETSGNIVAKGSTLADGTTGANSTNFSYLDERSKVKSINITEYQNLGVYQRKLISTVNRSQTASVNETLTISVDLATISDWHTVTIKMRCVTNRVGSSSTAAAHEVWLTVAMTASSTSTVATTDAEGSGIITVGSISAAGSTLSVPITITAQVDNWAYQLLTEVSTTAIIEGLTVS